MQNILTPNQARAARSSLKLSQERVANEVGLNRSYISQFESGKMLLDDAQLTSLRDFFDESGFEFSETRPQPLPTTPESGCFWERDGLIISNSLTEEVAETLLNEYGELRKRIQVQGAGKVHTLLFGAVSRDSESQAEQLLTLMARCFQLVEILHGRRSITDESAPLPDEAKTIQDLAVSTLSHVALS